MKVSLFITCMCDIFSANVGKDTVELLERFGCEVDFPEAQTCCGQPAYNSGYITIDKETMKHMMSVFRDAEYVVGPSGSCVAHVARAIKMFSAGILSGSKKRKNLERNALKLPNFLSMY